MIRVYVVDRGIAESGKTLGLSRPNTKYRLPAFMFFSVPPSLRGESGVGLERNKGRPIAWERPPVVIEPVELVKLTGFTGHHDRHHGRLDPSGW